jgi:hypothetical protein
MPGRSLNVPPEGNYEAPAFQTEAGEYATYTAASWDGQRDSVFPSLDMVVVMIGGNYLSEDPGEQIIEK